MARKGASHGGKLGGDAYLAFAVFAACGDGGRAAPLDVQARSRYNVPCSATLWQSVCGGRGNRHRHGRVRRPSRLRRRQM